MQKTFERFNWPKVQAILAEGEDAEPLYEDFMEDVRDNYNNNPNLRVLSYDKETKSLIGSNIFIVSGLTELLESSGIRTAIPSDDRYGDISRLVKDRFYTDLNALVLRTAGDSYKPSDKLAKDLAGKIENRERKIKLPVMVVSPILRYNPEFEEYNGLVFDLGEKTQIIEDDRLDGKKYPSELRFNEVDEIGLPKFGKEGTRTWYAREDGLSMFGLYGLLVSLSSDEYLACSGGGYKVVLVRGEATREKIPEK